MTTLHYLPGIGDRENWGPERGYRVESSKEVDGLLVIMGRITFEGRAGDWFVARYTRDGQRAPGYSGMRWWAQAREVARRAYDQIRKTRGPKLDPDEKALVEAYFADLREAAE